MKNKRMLIIAEAILIIACVIMIGVKIYENRPIKLDEDAMISQDKVITVEEAEKILEDKYGKEDKETGNIMSYGYITTVKDETGNEYYAFRHSWLVNNDHMSFLQNVFVSLDGKIIKTNSESAGYEEGEIVNFDVEQED